MCGIAVIVDFRDNGARLDLIAEAMIGTMVHRGPDECGVQARPHVGLGHRRLSIIDLASGQQPMLREDGKKIIVFNGEIYNFQELRGPLASQGHRFRTNSDTEVLLAAYEAYGPRCLDRLRGMFAFAIWDATREQLFVARDRLGKKPLYYAITDGALVIASEIKALLATGTVSRDVDQDAIDCFMSLGYTLAPDTAFAQVKKLPAGHQLTFDRSGLRIDRYWNLGQEDRLPRVSTREGILGTRALLEEAVGLRMISDVPLGAFLSGGLDSTIIVGIMSRLSNQPVKTFTVGYEDAPEHSELSYARLAADHFGTDHREIILQPMAFFQLLDKMITHLEEPIGDQACIPLFLLSEQAKREVTVLLSGEGSDELFAGYPIYTVMQLLGLYRSVPAPVRETLGKLILRTVFDGRRAEKYTEWAGRKLEERYLGDMADLSDSLKARLYSRDFQQRVRGRYRDAVKRIYQEVAGAPDLDRMLYLDVNSWLVEDLLLKADKMTMAASIELRTPFLDHKVVEFSRRLPTTLKARGWSRKRVLKTAFRDMVPPGIMRRPKRGFPVPLSLWFKGDLNDQIAQVLLDSRTRQRGYFDHRVVEKMIHAQKRGASDHSKTIWNLLVLEFWHRTFVDAAV